MTDEMVDPDGGIYDAVKLRFSNPAASETANGPIAQWDTRRVTIMTQLFCARNCAYNRVDEAWNFNGDLSGWDTSSVTLMNSMFRSPPPLFFSHSHAHLTRMFTIPSVTFRPLH
jgi:surface protein